jgi:parallel beta-helix repeat protein
MNYLKPLVALIISATLSSAQTVITSLPYTISSAGTYLLNQTLYYPSGSGNAITVAASNVTLNLNGYGIINTANQTTTTATCVSASNFENISIENGEIFGFQNGIHLLGPSTGLNFNTGHIVQGLRLAYCTFRGIFLENSSNCLVQNCLLSSIGTTGGGVHVGLGYGIVVFSLGGGTRVYRCQVLNATETGFVGVITGGSQGSYFEQNLATHCNFGFAFGDAAEAYRDNASFGSTTAFSSGNDFGGNHSQ